MYFSKKGIISQMNWIILKTNEVFLSKLALNSPPGFETLINILLVLVTERQLFLSQLSEYSSIIHFLDK
jgi:hypothetical protein